MEGHKGGSENYTVDAMENGAPPNPKILTDEKGFARSDLEKCKRPHLPEPLARTCKYDHNCQTVRILEKLVAHAMLILNCCAHAIGVAKSVSESLDVMLCYDCNNKSGTRSP